MVAPPLGGRKFLPLKDLPFCLPLPLKETGDVFCDPELVGTELEDSVMDEGTPERAPLVVAFPFPEPFPFGVCAKKETLFVCGRFRERDGVRDNGAEERGRFGFTYPFPLSTGLFFMKSGNGTLNSLALIRK